MRTYEAFILGAITSGLVAWLWGKEITAYVREQTRGVRTQATVAFAPWSTWKFTICRMFIL